MALYEDRYTTSGVYENSTVLKMQIVAKRMKIPFKVLRSSGEEFISAYGFPCVVPEGYSLTEIAYLGDLTRFWQEVESL